MKHVNSSDDQGAENGSESAVGPDPQLPVGQRGMDDSHQAFAAQDHPCDCSWSATARWASRPGPWSLVVRLRMPPAVTIPARCVCALLLTVAQGSSHSYQFAADLQENVSPQFAGSLRGVPLVIVQAWDSHHAAYCRDR
jgi:hypothetical protein